MSKTVRLPAILAIIFLSACTGGGAAEDLLEAYLKNVENATGSEGRSAARPFLLTYPSHRDRTLPVEDIRVGLLGFLKYYGCDLMHLVSERNTILGKVMPISQRLMYEIEFLQRAEGCYQRIIQQLEPDEAFLEEIRKTIRIKRENLAKVFWNATFDSPEMQKAFSLAVRPLSPGDEEEVYADSHNAIDYFHGLGERLGDPLLEVEKSKLEQQYYALQRYQYGGRLANSLVQLIDYLNRASHALEAAIEKQSLCPPGKPNEKDRLLQALFKEDYAEGIQPYLSSIRQQGKNWLAAIDRLIEIQSIEIPGAFADYRRRMLSLDAKDGLWQEFENAIRRHEAAWRIVSKRCGL